MKIITLDGKKYGIKESPEKVEIGDLVVYNGCLKTQLRISLAYKDRHQFLPNTNNIECYLTYDVKKWASKKIIKPL